ncbi:MULTISPECIES: GntR family transcriptional regulator [Nonomuraea]|uniref:GntR family transcriptional regulator n=1 Tax=Nonomuraea ferruginea TaxID=46174 RepID=A0ABT4TDC0_9ACTN|nr:MULTISPECIES: GntR family transcriptional regulator [Nonomuraea]MDA0646946.1 GntR family transcriptional regulator [Nonomuraea ferruginea]TXK40823.1 GntR family transcriptional regulator [Nonomuraea sp. C10]
MSVIDDLRSLILGGRYAPGDRLGEVELAQLLQVSRTPVREALRQLQSEGLVEVTANKGARVIEYPAADLETIFELRARIEGLAARQAAATATDEDVERLHEVAVSLGEHAGRRELDAVYRLNAEFHQELVRLGGSTVLAQSISALVHSPVLLRTYSAFDEEAMRRSVNHHIEIAAAVRAGDPEWAEAVMRAHLFSARASLLGPRKPRKPRKQA